MAMDANRLGSVWQDDTASYGFLEGSLRSHAGADKAWGGVDSISLALNLVSTLLYTVCSRKSKAAIVD